MKFDLINYTYSGLISIFSMIMGMAYPLVNSAITAIDTKYGGNRMSEKVLLESGHIRFRIALAISIVVSLLTPFALYYLKDNSDLMYIWELLQTIVILMLVVKSIQLHNLIIRYKLPRRLYKYNSKEDVTKEDVIVLAEIARYAARNNDCELYLQSTLDVCRKMEYELQKGIIRSTLTPLYTQTNKCRLSKETKEALAIYTSIVCDLNIKERLYRVDCSLLNTFFSSSSPLLAGEMLIIWKTVQEAARQGNDDFVKQYWTYAVQHYSIIDYSRIRIGANTKQKALFREEKINLHKFHTALLGMLLYLNRKKCLASLLYYSRTLPYSYPLCCNRLQNIFDEWKLFYQDGDTMKLLMQLQEFPLAGNEHGVDSEWYLLKIMERILAIQVLRLNGIDNNEEHDKSLADINVGDNIEDKYKAIKLLERMKITIEDVCKEGLDSICNPHNHYTKDEAIELVDDNIKRIERELRKNEEVIDEEKLAAIEEEIQSVWNKIIGNWENPNKLIAYETACYERKVGFNLPKEMFCKNYKTNGFINLLVEALVLDVQRVKMESFNLVKPVKNFRIEYQDIGLALEKLRLSSDYVILYNSIDFDLYYSCYKQFKGYRKNHSGARFVNEALLEEQFSYTRNPFMIILKRDYLPCLTIGKGNEDRSNEKTPLKIKIENSTSKSSENNYIKAEVKLHYPKNLRYIRIDIPYVLSDMDIDKITSINQLL